jgi:PHD/YefM family antitoxin component YafN of YafNO toxin-antitoxin module
MISSARKTISVTDLVRNASRIADAIEAGATYRITRSGRGNMLLVDEEYFDGWMAAIEEIQRPGWREALSRSKRDVAAGRGKDLDTVLREMGLEESVRGRRREPAGTPRGGGARRKRSSR